MLHPGGTVGHGAGQGGESDHSQKHDGGPGEQLAAFAEQGPGAADHCRYHRHASAGGDQEGAEPVPGFIRL